MGEVDTRGLNNEKTRHYRIWKTTDTADASILLTPEYAALIGNKNNFVAVGPTGVALTGNVSMNCLSEQRRQGGMFVPMNDFIRMIPPTIVTPLPPQIPFPPIAFPLAILAGTAFFVAMLV